MQINNCYQYFLDLCVMEERIKGNLPAFEGIRLVREVKTETEAETT